VSDDTGPHDHEGKDAMNDRHFTRVRIAGLYGISFLGLVIHTLMHLFEGHILVLREAMKQTPDYRPLLEPMDKPGMMLMMGVFFTLALVPVALPLMTRGKHFRWVTAVLGALMTLMSVLDGVYHMAADRAYVMGACSVLICGFTGTWGSVLAMRWALEKNKVEQSLNG